MGFQNELSNQCNAFTVLQLYSGSGAASPRETALTCHVARGAGRVKGQRLDLSRHR